MYESFFGFRERPFDLAPDPRFVVLTEAHREALSNLEYGIASRKGITMLVGEPGTGKTTMIRAAMENQTNRVLCVHLTNPTLSRTEFNEMLAVRFGLSERAAHSKAALLVELEALLVERRSRDETTVLIVDEAQSLPPDLLEEIRLLANIETNQDKLLNLVLAGQPELSTRLNEPSLRQLKQRVALRCELRALTALETSAYVAGRIRTAGGEGSKAFTSDAVALIHQRARGLPRAVNVIADNALIGGLAANQKPVTQQIVSDVCRDFDFGTSFEPPERPSTVTRMRLAPAPPAPPVAPVVEERPEPFTSAAPRRARYSLFRR